MADNDSPDDPDPNDFTDPSPYPDSDIELAMLGDDLQDRGIAQVLIRYDGSADSGGVEKVEFEPANARVPDWIEDKLRDLAEWYCPDGYGNDDGGYGTLTVYLSAGLAELEHTDRYADSENMEPPRRPCPRNCAST